MDGPDAEVLGMVADAAGLTVANLTVTPDRYFEQGKPLLSLTWPITAIRLAQAM